MHSITKCSYITNKILSPRTLLTTVLELCSFINFFSNKQEEEFVRIEEIVDAQFVKNIHQHLRDLDGKALGVLTDWPPKLTDRSSKGEDEYYLVSLYKMYTIKQGVINVEECHTSYLSPFVYTCVFVIF